MSSKSFKVNSKDAKDLVSITSILAFKFLLVRELTKEPKDSTQTSYSEF